MLPRLLFLSSEPHWSRAERLPLACHEAGIATGLVYVSGSSLALIPASWHGVWKPDTWIKQGVMDSAVFEKQLLWCVEQFAPDLLVSLDDAVVLAIAAATPWLTARGGIHRELFVRSFGDLTTLADRLERRSLIRIATSGLLDIAPSCCPDSGNLSDFGARHGYECCIKWEQSAAGIGVTRVSCPSEFEQACLAAMTSRRRFVVQRFIKGMRLMRMFVAQDGNVVAGVTMEKRCCYPEPFGPSSVVVPCDAPATEEACKRLAQYWRISGCASADFIREEGTDAIYLIEFNPRPVTLMHLGEYAGVSFTRALSDLAAGVQSLPQQERYENVAPIALFPKEWFRDANSAYLKPGALHDVPWQYPLVVQHYVRQHPEVIDRAR